MKIITTRLTGRYYLEKKWLGGFDVYVQEEKIVSRGFEGIRCTELIWREATTKDVIELKIFR